VGITISIHCSFTADSAHAECKDRSCLWVSFYLPTRIDQIRTETQAQAQAQTQTKTQTREPGLLAHHQSRFWMHASFRETACFLSFTEVVCPALNSGRKASRNCAQLRSRHVTVCNGQIWHSLIALSEPLASSSLIYSTWTTWLQRLPYISYSSLPSIPVYWFWYQMDNGGCVSCLACLCYGVKSGNTEEHVCEGEKERGGERERERGESITHVLSRLSISL
jgi:hypothetical protein